MYKSFAIIFLVYLFLPLLGQQPDFSIVDENGQPMESVTIIFGVPLQLSTNYTAIRGTEVFFPVNFRTSNDTVPYEIGFSFTFYGQTYTEYFIGANGYITFDNPPRNPAIILTELPFATLDPQYPRNSIFATFKGWDIEGRNCVTTLLTGTAPIRQLVITWCKVPALQSEEDGSFQLILHESGEIDIHLIEIPYSGYAGNSSVVGIQDPSGFQGLAVPGRNWTPWPPVAGESWKFSWVNSDYQVQSISYSPYPVTEYINWYELDAAGGKTWISDAKQINVSPRTNTRYQAEVSSCWGEIIDIATIDVTVEGVFPNAFNPGSDIVMNQTFKMPKVEGVVFGNFRLQIYNSWGQMVFETTDANIGWNGLMYNTGKVCPIGVYYWILIIEEEGKNSITNSGSVTLLR